MFTTKQLDVLLKGPPSITQKLAINAAKDTLGYNSNTKKHLDEESVLRAECSAKSRDPPYCR
jgi:hypothetical protein